MSSLERNLLRQALKQARLAYQFSPSSYTHSAFCAVLATEAYWRLRGADDAEILPPQAVDEAEFRDLLGV